MSELSGTAAVGIETVEWFDGVGGNLTVSVTGRWRRRRPASSGQVSLVVEADGQRHRFTAMPEPPSLLDGTGPGMWRLSFTVPGWLAPSLGRHTWLALGTVLVPLPAPRPSGSSDRGGTAPEAAPSPAPALAHEAMATPAAAPAPEPPRARDDQADRIAAELAERVQTLERELADLGSARERLTASLAEGERTRRIAEQRAHAEQALRRDLARRLATGEREVRRAREALGELAAAEDRIRVLEDQLNEVRRRSDEAEQAAAAAIAARARAERQERAAPAVHPPARQPAEAPERARLRFEDQMRQRQAASWARVPAEPVAPPPPLTPRPAPVAPPPAPVVTAPVAPAAPAAPAPSGLVDTLRRELDARAASDAALRSRVVAAETRLAARVLLDQRTAATLAELRTELDGLRAALERERAHRDLAERSAAELSRERDRRVEAERRTAELERQLGGQRDRSRDAYDAIGELRGALERLRPPVEPAPLADLEVADAPDAASGPPAADAAADSAALEPARLSDALTRLRESVVAPEPDPSEAPPAALSATALSPSARLPVAPGRPTLERAFRRLVRSDAQAAGRLLLELVPLQRLAYPHPVSYDLVLGPGHGCLRVSVGQRDMSVELQGAARTRDEVDFRVTGSPARIARLLIAHGLWRWLGLRVARVRGRRDGLAALRGLLTLPLDFGWLAEARVALAPASALSLAAAMVVPEWTAGESFVLAHRDPEASSTTYLIVRDGRRIEVTAATPPGRIATTIEVAAAVLPGVLAGAPDVAVAIEGDEGPLTTLRGWIKRAQSE